MRLRELGQDELMIKVVATGICHTDVLVGNLKEVPSYVYPSVQGHEGMRTVDEPANMLVLQPLAE